MLRQFNSPETSDHGLYTLAAILVTESQEKAAVVQSYRARAI